MNSAALRTLVIYAVILPLAVFIGWLLSGDMTRSSFAMLASITFVLLTPLLLKWHYPVMVLSWSTSITIFFLPGQPALWMLMAAINFGIAVLGRIMLKRQAFFPAPAITFSLLFLAAVVIVTAQLRGGIGMRILGGAAQGGKGYIFVLAAIIGFFALASQKIPAHQAKFYVMLFLLPGAISVFSNLIYFAGPAFYFLFLIVPVGFAGVQATSEMSGSIARVAGFSTAGQAIAFFLMARFGLRGLLYRKWAMLLMLAVLAMGAMGGYRSTFLLMGLLFIILFIAEGLLRSPLFPALILLGALSFAILIPLASKLPQSMQRTLSFLPLPIDSRVRSDAEGSWDWRVEIWRAAWPDVPKYFWLGKGYTLDPTDMHLTLMAIYFHRAENYEGSLLAGDYHSGPLSLIIPFGIFGTVAFLIFLGAGLRALWLNYRHGSQELATYNRFLFAFFLTRVIFFFGAFGAFSVDLYMFTGITGLSLALNHGICRKPVLVQRPFVFRGRLNLGAAQPSSV